MEGEEQSVENLLQEVIVINSKWQDEFDKTGERFNVFEILGLTSNETRTHSAFIGELLNPKAYHGAGTKFLELFLNEIEFEKFEMQSTKIDIEKYVGPIPNDYESGGRVDLFISDCKRNCVLIENKIYAEDQHKQLYRYYKYCKNPENNNFQIIYLNLNGESPSSNSTEGNDYKLKIGEHFKIISYKENIINWLTKCAISADDKPIVREAINHYITLIKNLTGQSNIKKMEQEITTLLLTDIERFKSAKAIKDSYDKVRQDIYNKFKEETKLKKELQIAIKGVEYLIRFQLQEDNDGFYFSFSGKTKEGEWISNRGEIFDILIKIVRQIDSRFTNNEHNIGWKYPNNLRRFFELSDDTIFELSQKTNRDAYIAELFEEGEKYFSSFKKSIKELDITH